MRFFIFMLMVFGAPAFAAENCEQKFVQIAKAYFLEQDGKQEVESKLNNNPNASEDVGQDFVDVETFKLEYANDLDQGSYNLDRSVVISAEIKNAGGQGVRNIPEAYDLKLYFLTHGEMFCDGETVTAFTLN